jgi:hypothetical protein
MKFKELYSLFENQTIQRLLAKIVACLWAFWAFSDLLHGLTNSHGLKLSSDLCHQTLSIFWTRIVGVDLPFQVRPKIIDRLHLWDVWWIFFLWDVKGRLRSVQTPNQASTRFFCFLINL